MDYTPEQLERRNRSLWTTVQGIGALVQFLTFVASLVLVTRFVITGQDYALTTVVCVAKVLMLYFMTVTGMAWEDEVFGRFFLAPQMFWEDVGNVISLTGNTAYLVTLLVGAEPSTQMAAMGVALATYVLNFFQFAIRGARAARQRRRMTPAVAAEA